MCLLSLTKPLLSQTVVCCFVPHLLQKYDTFVTLLTELHMLREADLFIGTFSSNIGRLMVPLREASGFPRNTTRSVHVGVWVPGRK